MDGAGSGGGGDAAEEKSGARSWDRGVISSIYSDRRKDDGVLVDPANLYIYTFD